MAYLFLLALFFSTPAHAEFGFDDGIRQPQSMMVAGNSIIDDDSEEITVEDGDKTDYADETPAEKLPPIEPIANPVAPIEPTSPSAPISTKKVLKQIPKVESTRSIADDRIDDGYVQDLIKQNFNFKK